MLKVRKKRQVEVNNLNEDGLPIRSGSYGNDGEEQQGDTEGLRIYDAWFQHRNAKHIPKSRTAPQNSPDDSDPIKPYHRTSASWVEKRTRSSHNLNAHFDDKVFREKYPKRRRKKKKHNSGSAIDMPQTNFFKITPTEKVTLVIVFR